MVFLGKNKTVAQGEHVLLLDANFSQTLSKWGIRAISNIISCMHISAYLPGSSLCCCPWVVLGVVCIVCGRCRNADLLEMSGCDRWLFEICVQAKSLREQLHTFAMLYRRPCWCWSPLAHSWGPHSTQHTDNWLFNCLQPGKSRHVVRTCLWNRAVILTSFKSFKEAREMNIEYNWHDELLLQNCK